MKLPNGCDQRTDDHRESVPGPRGSPSGVVPGGGKLRNRIRCVHRLLLVICAGFVCSWIQAAPFGLQVGDLLVANYGGNNILKIDAVTWDQQNLGTFDVPTDLVLAPDGNLYVSEWNGTIKRLTLTNGLVTVVNPGTSLSELWGIALGPDGFLYVTSGADDSVSRVDPATGTETLVTRSNLLSSPVGIEFTDPGHVIIGSLLNNQIVSVDLADGTQTSVVNAGQGLDQPWGIGVYGGDLYATAYDTKLIQRVSGGTVENLASTSGFPYGIGVLADGSLWVGVSGTTYQLVHVSTNGATLGAITGGLIRQVTGIEIASLSLSADGLTNHPPVVSPLPNHVVTAGTEVAFTVPATDADWPPQTLSFSLDPGAPTDAILTAAGAFTWTPTNAPASVTISVRVADDGVPSLSAVRTFSITVTANTPPVLNPIPDQTVFAGSTLSFVATAHDHDTPAQTLAFSLGPGAPGGAVISPDGLFTWTPPADTNASTHPITVTVTDDGLPGRSASTTFNIAVSPPAPPNPGDILVASWAANAVIKIDPLTGRQQRLAPFTAPTDLALGFGGDLLYVCQYNGTVRSLNLTNGTSRIVNPGTTITEAWAIARGPRGNLFVASGTHNGIVALDPPTGQEQPLATGGLMSGPTGVDLLDASHLVVSSAYNNRLVSVAIADGTQTLLTEDAALNQPWGVAVSGADVFIANSGATDILKLSGSTLTHWYTTDGSPYGLTVETNGNVWIGVSSTNEYVMQLSPDATPLNTYADGLIAGASGLEVYQVIPAPPNAPPVPASPMLERDGSFGAKLPIAAFLGTDPDGDPVTLTSVEPVSAAGGNVDTVGGWIIYHPPPGLIDSDSFRFTVSDGLGAPATGMASVVVRAKPDSTANLRTEPSGGDTIRILGDGIPGRSYVVEYRESLNPAVWHPVATCVADQTGAFEATDSPPGGAPVRTYRAVEP